MPQGGGGRLGSDTVRILDGSTFVVSDGRGDIDAEPDQPLGMFFRDTRYLSRFMLTIDGVAPQVLSVDRDDYFAARFFLYPASSDSRTASVSVWRHRSVGDGLHEDLVVLNHANEPVSVQLELAAGADFADLFEVREALKKKGTLYHEVRDDALVLGYKRDDYVRETVITATEAAEFREDGLTFRVDAPPRGSWTTCVHVEPRGDHEVREKHGHGSMGSPEPNMEKSLHHWILEAPELASSWERLGLIYWRTLVDLAALRFYPEILPGASVPAAGLPWFMALFGRDSILTSYQALPFAPDLADTTLRVLATRQGTRVDDFRDEEPGKILHELRFGELTTFQERPHSPYYGTADATPLWLVLLDETERWTGNDALVRELEPNARAALEWIDGYGDSDGDGYVEYQTRNPESGLENQCWKDSWNSVLFADGSNSELPRATCEIQGYVYDAKRRSARLAREFWGDADLADRLEREAAELKERFNVDFWLPERGAFALALDGRKRKVDSLTSNMGHLLWSGIADEDKAEQVVAHLMSPAMFSGWGVRTMAYGEAGYNPIEYHNGTVWPHDNGLIAAGLRRYGHPEQAATIAYAILEAATSFEWRLPEVFAGYPRSLTRFPVEYPTASSPQAWATGTPLLLLRVLLGLEPDGENLRSDPMLPTEIRELALRDIRGRWPKADVVAGR